MSGGTRTQKYPSESQKVLTFSYLIQYGCKLKFPANVDGKAYFCLYIYLAFSRSSETELYKNEIFI